MKLARSLTPDDPGSIPGNPDNAAPDAKIQDTTELNDLKKINEELRQARRTALNLMEDAIRAKEALAESEQKLKVTMESAIDYAIITMDTGGLIQNWSRGAAKMFLYDESDVLGKPISMLYTEEDQKNGIPQKEMRTARITGRASDNRWHKRKNGSTFYCNGVLNPIYNPDLKGYVKVASDMTSEQLFTEQLNTLVDERTFELQKSNEDLRQFAHVASHDLKEPVRKITFYNNRLIREFGDAFDSRAIDCVQKIRNACNRMDSMIEGVLRYSKTDSLNLPLEKVDLDQIITEIKSDLDLLIEQKQAVIHTSVMPVLMGYRALLYQLFYNVILNSLKFSKAGVPARIGINCETIADEGNEFYRITISDNGIGFDKTDSEKIFIAFTRLNSMEEYEGTGLGLALCKKIVLRHNGEITATGKPDHGATITILLPTLALEE